MSDKIQTIARVRRAMPRNKDVMDVCDMAEESLASSSVVERSAVNAVVAGSTPASSAKPPFDRKAYMRDYMKQRRKKEKSK